MNRSVSSLIFTPMIQEQQSEPAEEQTQQKADQQKAAQAAPAQRAAYADSARREDEGLAQLKEKADRSNAVTNLQALQRKANDGGRVHELKSTAAALNEAMTKNDGPVQRAEKNKKTKKKTNKKTNKKKSQK